MHQSDFIQIVTIGLFRKLLHGENHSIVAEVEQALKLSFGNAPEFNQINFLVESDSKQAISFLEWFAWAKQQAVEGIELRLQSDFGVNRPQSELNGKAIEQRYLAAFCGSHENAIALRLADCSLGFRYQIEYPPQTLITLDDALAFIDAHPQDRAFLHDASLWQNQHNFHFGDAATFGQFIKLLSPDRVTRYIDAFAIMLSNVEVAVQTRDDWWSLWREKRNPAPPQHWVFSFGKAHLAKLQYEALSTQRAHLRSALNEILDFSRKHSLNEFSAAFERALSYLDLNATIENHPWLSILERLYPVEQFRLFAALSACGVFGGMGTWNDLGFDADSEYARVSDQLFNLRNVLMQSTCNSSDQSPQRLSILNKIARFFWSK